MPSRHLFKINSLTRTGVAASALLLAAALAGCGESAAESPAGAADAAELADPGTLVIAHIPSEDSTSFEEDHAVVAKVIEDVTGKSVEFHTATSYAAVIEAQRAGKVQIAGYGPFSYMVAKDSGAGVKLVGYAAETKDDPGGYHSVASVGKNSTITSLEQLAGKKVCYVDPTSTSGYLFPSAGLLDAGIDPEQDVEAIFAGGHDASVLAIADGQCDAGFSTDTMAKQELIKSGQLKQGDIKIIWESELIPPSPTAISDSLSPELQDQLVDVYTEKLNVDWLTDNGYCDDSHPSCGLPSDEMWGYKPVDDATYDGIREVCRITKSDSCQGAE